MLDVFDEFIQFQLVLLFAQPFTASDFIISIYLSVRLSVYWYEWIWMAYTGILSCDRRNHFNVVITHLTLIEANAI